ncbi:hypothetical protein GL270_21200 [Aeromonas veronii]|uniref:hypothetical protein n=1 Tax=Aeromonas veronii TaxID=654 RepID=UPI001C5BF816|nr:hypothetical protein [Aeromonas veronii]MBW3783719.1 hypothetical protein [Aeromonas veronii]
MGAKFYFDVDQLIVDLGGVMCVARTLGIPRGYLWAWRKDGRLPSKRWVEIKNQWPQVTFDKYFKPTQTDLGEGHQ